MRNFDEYYDYIINRGSTGGKHTLDKIRKLLEIFDNPQDKIQVIHVAGTNGKGSTSNMIANTLAMKNKVGLFVSPYMTKINEAISINGENISDEDFMDIVDRLKEPIERLDKEGFHNSYFEVLTAVMYIYFYEKEVDVAVVEVGLGGTLDSTNVINKPLAAVITTISRDHIQILGDSLEEIAGNKAGIIKDSSQVFLYPKEGSVKEVFVKKSKETSSEIHTFTKDEVVINKLGPDYNEFSFRDYKSIKTQLIGIHQVYNATTALMVLDYLKDKFSLTTEDIYRGIFEAENAGRLQLISKNPRILVDGSHNSEAIDALAEAIKSYSYDKLIVGFSILKDKDYSYVINKLSSIADEMVITEIKDNPRAFALDDLEKIVKVKFPKVKKIRDDLEAYKFTKSLATSKDLVIWCGSLYLVGDILKHEAELK